jgi:diaminopimelate epimerase
MSIQFYKYQGTGNDFILVEDWDGKKERALEGMIAHYCDRRFGIGADGFIFIQKRIGYDFYMRYYNSDGKISSMCGNGGRCIIALADYLGIIEKKASFLAVDGPHTGYIEDDIINLMMSDVSQIKEQGEDFVLDTGSPHFIRFVKDYKDIDVNKKGAGIRYSEPYSQNGINVNFVELDEDQIFVATYERGVEGETLSCGTGVTAAALATKVYRPQQFNNTIKVSTKGGALQVKFNYSNDVFTDVWLCGPAVYSFEGIIKI